MAEPTPAGKPFSVPAMLGLVVVYLLILQGTGWLISGGSPGKYAEFPDIGSILQGLVLPVGLSVVLVLGVITWLDWWPRVIHEALRLGNWAWSIPKIMVISMVAVTNYGSLADNGL